MGLIDRVIEATRRVNHCQFCVGNTIHKIPGLFKKQIPLVTFMFIPLLLFICMKWIVSNSSDHNKTRLCFFFSFAGMMLILFQATENSILVIRSVIVQSLKYYLFIYVIWEHMVWSNHLWILCSSQNTLGPNLDFAVKFFVNLVNVRDAKFLLT